MATLGSRSAGGGALEQLADSGISPAPAAVARDGDALVFRGALDRAAVAGLWKQAQPVRAGVAKLDLSAVSRVDSAGLALLVELAGDGMAIVGAPVGLAELRAAYRLGERLQFAH